jgi:hypothetical protein
LVSMCQNCGNNVAWCFELEAEVSAGFAGLGLGFDMRNTIPLAFTLVARGSLAQKGRFRLGVELSGFHHDLCLTF